MNGAKTPSYWLVVKDEMSRMEVLTIRRAGREEVLPVFSFEEEARMFLEYGAAGSGWRVRETSPGELASVLFGPCAGVERVALDPSPGIGTPLDLVCVRRKEFARLLLEKESGRRAGDAKGKTALGTARSNSRSLALL
jgi:hypothetical protein